MVTVSHCLSLTRGSKKSKIKTIIQSLDTIPRHDEVKCLTVNINRVSGASLPEMILHCEIQTGPMSPDWGHMPLSSPVTKILMWHNINIRDVTQTCDPTNKSSGTFPFIRFVSSSDWPSSYPFILLSLDQKRSVGRLGRWKNFYLIGQIHAETGKLTDYYWASSASIFYRFCVDYLNCV